MMVQDKTDRVLWINFDCAQTYPLGSMTEEQKEWMAGDKELMTEFADELVSLLSSLLSVHS